MSSESFLFFLLNKRENYGYCRSAWLDKSSLNAESDPPRNVIFLLVCAIPIEKADAMASSNLHARSYWNATCLAILPNLPLSSVNARSLSPNPSSLCRTRQTIIADKTIELLVHNQRQTIWRQRIIEYPRENCVGCEQKCTYILVQVVQTVVPLEDKPQPVLNVAALISTTGWMPLLPQ